MCDYAPNINRESRLKLSNYLQAHVCHLPDFVKRRMQVILLSLKYKGKEKVRNFITYCIMYNHGTTFFHTD